MSSPHVAGAVALYLSRSGGPVPYAPNGAARAGVDAVTDVFSAGGGATVAMSAACGYDNDAGGESTEPMLFLNGGAFGGDGSCDTGGGPTNDPPAATLTVSPTSGTAPLDVTIDLTCSDSDGTVVLYELDTTGDGSFEISGTSGILGVARTYEQTTTVSGRCTDDQGADSGTMSQQVTVSPGGEPAPAWVAAGVTAVQRGRTFKAQLDWSGGAVLVDIWKDGELHAQGQANDGSYTDNLGKNPVTVTYEVCNAGTAPPSASACTGQATLGF
jgi:hypothetical protein